MANDLQFDVFLSHSSKDKAVVRDIAERLQEDDVRVWLDEEQIKPGDSIPRKIEEGLVQSRVERLQLNEQASQAQFQALNLLIESGIGLSPSETSNAPRLFTSTLLQDN
jgi:hypothetical protein